MDDWKADMEEGIVEERSGRMEETEKRAVVTYDAMVDGGKMLVIIKVIGKAISNPDDPTAMDFHSNDISFDIDACLCLDKESCCNDVILELFVVASSTSSSKPSNLSASNSAE